MWLIKKLTATFLTLGLADIGKEVGIDSVDEVREIILSMVRLCVAARFDRPAADADDARSAIPD